MTRAVNTALAGSGGVLQVVSTTYNTQVTVATTTYTDTGLSISITPTSATSKILVIVQQQAYFSRSANNVGGAIRLLRDSTIIFTPAPADSSGPYLTYFSASGATGTTLGAVTPITYLDSPATTNTITYKTQGALYASTSSGSVKFQASDSTATASSTITLLEIAA